MMKIQGEFDPLAVVIDWLDACRSGGLVVLLDLYDDLAILECDCERVSLTGRHAIAAYITGHQSWKQSSLPPSPSTTWR